MLDNIMLGVEPCKAGFLQKEVARKKVVELSEKYGLRVDPDALVSDISVGMQQRVEILKMLYRDNEILIFDEPTAVLTPQEIDELMEIMRGFKAEGKSILFITHKLNEIMAVADRCTVLRKGKYIGTVDIANSAYQGRAFPHDGWPRCGVGGGQKARPTPQAVLDVRKTHHDISPAAPIKRMQSGMSAFRRSRR